MALRPRLLDWPASSSIKPHQVAALRRPRTEARARRLDDAKGVDLSRPVTEGACPSNRCSNPSEFDSSLDYEQALSPLEYRSDAASAAECAGLRAQGPRLVIVGLVRESLDLKAIPFYLGCLCKIWT